MPTLPDLFRDPSQLIASIPASLGYTPQRELVLIVVSATVEPRSPKPALVVRSVTATSSLTESVAKILKRLRRAAQGAAAFATFAIVVDDRFADSPPGSPHRTTIRRLIDELTDEFTRGPAPLVGAWATREIAAGAPWFALVGEPEHGVIADPTLTDNSQERIIAGQILHGSKQDMADSLVPDLAAATELARFLPSANSDAKRRRDCAERHDQWARHHRHCLETVLWRIADVAAGDSIPFALLANLTAVMTERKVLDCLHATAVGEYLMAAEQLWILLIRSLTGPERAEPATLLAYSAYLRGDGPLAGVALDIALSARSSHVIARLLHACLSAGLAPQTLPRIARFGVAAATDLGVDIGEWQS
ncbi:DUF4192 domain-containing protein [Nocardia sp. NBC_01730]|uniref:DUF4192 domain-containing protein n=1 Tax=Nocardia sp. NBC_01730 TaxID=2975998 RepID=UPI002E0DA1C8|nr:DUF4192 domain-containing protein [Nocardia sp. NBC_01730]